VSCDVEPQLISVANLINRPLAGSLGLFVLPTRGIRASVRTAMGTQLDPHSVLRGPHEALTRAAITDLSPEYKRRLLNTFALLEAETPARKRRHNKAQWFLIANKEEREAERIKRSRDEAERRERKEMKKGVEGREREEKREKGETKRRW
jgi:sterol 3beta-glucosyltransferase